MKPAILFRSANLALASFLIMLVFASQSSHAQSFRVVGTASSTSSTFGPTVSTSGTNSTNRHTAIYTPAELNAAGISSGDALLGIGWDKSGTGNYIAGDLNIKIYLKHVPGPTFAAAPTYTNEIASGAILVYQTTTGNIPGATGFVKFNFNTGNSFVWNGQHLQVIVEIVRPVAFPSSSLSWRTLATVSNTAANQTTTSGTMTLNGVRPQVGFDVGSFGDDGSLIAVPSPIAATAGSQNLSVTLRNTGNTLLNAANIDVSVDGTHFASYAWSGSLNPGGSEDVILGTYNFVTGNHSMQASIIDVNGVPDVNNTNDVINKDFLVCNVMNGTSYTINKNIPTGGNNFSSFNDLATALATCGISGDVTINVVAGTGPYNEQVVFRTIPGTNTFTVTINGNGNTITTNTTSSERYVIRLHEVSKLTINDLKIIQGTYGINWFGVHLYSAGTLMKDVTLNNLEIEMNATTGVGITASGNLTSNLTDEGNFSNLKFSNNVINRGSYGISIYASGSTGIIVENNTISGYSSSGIYLFGTDGIHVRNNQINRSTDVGGSLSNNGVNIAQTSNSNARVYGNKFTCSASAVGTCKGIYLFGGTGHKVYNNLFYNIKPATGADYIAFAVRAGAPEISFNTVIYDHTAPAAVNLQGVAEELSNSGAVIKNNIFYMTQQSSLDQKFGISLTTSSNAATTVTSNNNVFWIPGGHVAAKVSSVSSTPSTYYTTLAAWQTISTQDAASVSVNPQIDLSSFVPALSTINNIGTPITGITTDINGATRGANPDPGVVEFTPAVDDAAITAFVSAGSICSGGSLPVQFTITNMGSSTLTSAIVNWTVNGTTQTPFNTLPAFSVAPGASQNVTLGTITVAANTTYTIEAVVSAPNGSTDPTAANNTFTVSGVRAGLSGNYTINKNAVASATNFVSFSSAAAALSEYGVCGAVVMDVVAGSGPYNEAVRFKNAPGASATNTITVNGNGDTLKVTAKLDFAPLVYFDGAQRMTLNNLVIHSLDNNYGWGVLLNNNAQFISLTNNTISLSADGTDRAAAIVASNSVSSTGVQGNNANNILISGNTFTKGYTGISIAGLSATPAQGIRIENNNLNNIKNHSISIAYTTGAIISGNTVRVSTLTSASTSDVRAIDAETNNASVAIEKNRIYDMWEGSSSTSLTVTGIYLGSTSSGTISNNLIYDLKNRGIQYGIRALGNNVNIYHNTVALNSTTSVTNTTSSAVYLSGSTAQTAVNIRNNIFVISRAGTGVKSMINVSNASTNPVSNNNVFFFGTSTGTPVIGRKNTTNYTDLTAWRGTSGIPDMNSILQDPSFKDSTTGNLQPLSVQVDGAAMNTSQAGSVTTDILGTVRSANPDAGAYEINTTAAPTISQQPSNVAGCLGFPASFSASTNSVPAPTATWERSADGVNWLPITGTLDGSVYSGFNSATLTITNVNAGLNGYQYRVTFTNANGSVTSTTATLTTGAASAGGTATGDQQICAGSSPNSLSLSGQVGNVIKWQKSTVNTFASGVVDINVANATLPGSSIGNLTATTYFRAVVKNNDCTEATSNVVTILVDQVSSGGIASNSQNICIGLTPTDLSLLFSNGNVLRWEQSNSSNFSSGVTTISNTSTILPSAMIGTPYKTTYYRAVVKNGVCADAYSTTGTIVVDKRADYTVGLAGTSGTQECASYDVASSNHYLTFCSLIATVVPNGASPVSGVINSCVKIEATVPTAAGNNQPYVQRYYQIIPATNAASATSRITLYFYQSEFDAYNAARGTYPALPTSGSDISGIANLRVSLFPGAITQPSGTGGVIIDPADVDVVENNGTRWEVSFNVTGSGTYFVHTGNFVLPVTITNFKGENAGSVNKLYWSTSTETNNYGFELERSADGVNYSKLTFVATKANGGNSTSQLSYNFDDVRPLVGANYYRLKQIDNNGKFVYSGVVVLNRKVSEITLTKVYPNPATREINVVITSPRAEKLTLVVTDLTGKVVMQTSTNVVTGDNQQQLNVSALAGGTYMIKAICANGCETAVHRFVKQ